MEVEVPKYWYNLIPDLPRPLPPPIDPPGEKSRIELLNEILPKELLRLQFTVERFIRIPEEVREIYEEINRPTPLMRAKRLEKMLNTRAKIFFKYEGANPGGSHKINTAIPQVFYASKEGAELVTTETGAGQWGTAVALASKFFNIKSLIFMVRASYEHKPSRRTMMKLLGSEVIPSPSRLTEFGRKVLAKDENHPGSLGIAMSEAIEFSLSKKGKYLVGSVIDAIIVHQSIIGEEAIKQLELMGEEVDILIGCVGGGSNFSGLIYPFIGRRMGKRYIGVGSSEVPKLTKGKYLYDFPDSAGLLPMLKMYTIGKDFVPPPIYSGGLRYHAISPSLSILAEEKVVEFKEYSEGEIYKAAKLFTEAEGIVPAPESAHAIASVIEEVRREKEEKKTILFNLSGHGLLDLPNYESMMMKYG